MNQYLIIFTNYFLSNGSRAWVCYQKTSQIGRSRNCTLRILVVFEKDWVFLGGMGQLLSKPINKIFSEVYLFLGELVVLLTRTKFFIWGISYYTHIKFSLFPAWSFSILASTISFLILVLFGSSHFSALTDFVRPIDLASCELFSENMMVSDLVLEQYAFDWPT